MNQSHPQHKNVLVYSRSTCPYCIEAKRLLTSKGVAFKEIDIGQHPNKRAEMIEKANGRSTVPQIFVGEQHIGGCDDLFHLERQGKLDSLLKT